MTADPKPEYRIPYRLNLALQEPATDRKISDQDLIEISHALRTAAQAVQELSNIGIGPRRDPQVAEILRQLSVEVARLDHGVSSSVLRVPSGRGKESRWLNPDVESFRYACVGCLDILQCFTSNHNAQKLLVAALAKCGRAVSVSSLVNWWAAYENVWEDNCSNFNKFCRLDARLQLTDYARDFHEVPAQDLEFGGDLSLNELIRRLDDVAAKMSKDFPPP
jgi:hypothetical protein